MHVDVCHLRSLCFDPKMVPEVISRHLTSKMFLGGHSPWLLHSCIHVALLVTQPLQT